MLQKPLSGLITRISLSITLLFSSVHALTVDPPAPIVAPGGTITLSASEYSGQVTWTDVYRNTLLSTQSSMLYTAPAQLGAFTVRVTDATGSLDIPVTVTPPSGREEATWEVFSDRGNINTLVFSEDGRILWAGTNGGVEMRAATSGEVLMVFSNQDRRPPVAIPEEEAWRLPNANLTGLPDNEVQALLPNARGGLWTGTANGLAYRATNGAWAVYIRDNSDLPHNDIRALAPDDAGGVWIGTGGGGLVHRTESGVWTVYTAANSQLPDNVVRALLLDNNGGLWLGTGQGGLAYRSAAGGWTLYNPDNSELPDTNIHTLLADPHDGLWIGTGAGGLAHRDVAGAWTIYNTDNSELSGNSVVSLALEDDGDLWVGTANNDLSYLAADGSWKVYRRFETELPRSGVWSLLAEPSGGVWIGTRKGGLAHLTADNKWTTEHTSNPGVADNDVMDLVLDRNGALWAATWGGGLAKRELNGEWYIYDPSNSDLPDRETLSLLTDDNGGLWVGTIGSGLAYRQADGNWLVYDRGNVGLPNDTVLALAADGAGGLWIGTGDFFGGALVHRSAAEVWSVYDRSYAEALNNPVSCILPNKDGSLWVGTGSLMSGAGLVYRNTLGEWTTYTKSNSGLPNNNVLTLLSDDGGELWVGTFGGGLAHLSADRTVWKVENTSNSDIPSDNVNSLLADGRGGLWVGTASGLAYRQAGGSVWSVYNADNSGLPNNAVASLLSDGRDGLWVGTIGGGLAHMTFNNKPTLCQLKPDQCNALYNQQRAAIVIYGEGAGNGTGQTRNLERLTVYVYNSLFRRGYSHSEIYLLSHSNALDFNSDAQPDDIVDAPAQSGPVTVNDMETALAWEHAQQPLSQPLIITYIGHALEEQLSLADGPLAATGLRGLLDDYQTATGNEVILILEACYSGSLVDDLVDGWSGPARTVFSSTGATEKAYYQGAASFTRFFYEALIRPEITTFGQAWNIAKAKVTGWTAPINRQLPMLGDTSDNGTALTQCLNGCGLGDLPGDDIIDVELSADTLRSGAPVWASIKLKDTRIGRLTLEIIPPNAVYDPDGKIIFDNLPVVALDVVDSVWQTPDYIPTEVGDYTVDVIALDSSGNRLTEVPASFRVVNQRSAGLARLVNLSTRARVSGGSNDAFAGFIVEGSGPLAGMLRGIAVDNDINPALSLLKYNGVNWVNMVANDAWNEDNNAHAIPQGLRLPDRNGNDAGLLRNLEPGVYTLQLSSNGANGQAVVGVDEVDEANSKLVNISTRARISGGPNDAFAGFIIRGSGTLPVMLRGIAVEAGVDPLITLLQQNSAGGWNTLAVNDEWESDSRAGEVQALPVNLHLPDRYGNDAGMLYDLPAGVYTLQLSSNGSAGQAVVGVDVAE